MDNIVHAVELGSLAAEPHFVQAQFLAFRGLPGQLQRYYGISAAGTGESSGLGEGAQFNGTILSSWDSKNAPRYIRVRDERFIGCIVQDDGVILPGIVHPFLQLFFAVGSPRGVVGRTQIDDVRFDGRVWHGQEPIFWGTVHIQDLTAPHHIGIHIDRIHRIRDQDHIAVIEQIRNVAAVALSPVTDEDFLDIQFNAMPGVIFLDGFLKESIALFRTIPSEGFFMSHFFHSLCHGSDDGGGQRERYISNAHLDDFLFWVCFTESPYPCSNICKQVAFLQLCKISIH